jgi:hypothetical protein
VRKPNTQEEFNVVVTGAQAARATMPGSVRGGVVARN